MSSVETLAMKNLLTAPPNQSVFDAVVSMSERRVGAILVVADSKLVGIFSERDAMQRVIAAGLDPHTTTLEQVCTREPKTVARDSPMGECVELIKRYGVRHVPVIDENGSAVGILSARDFLSYVINELEELIEQASRDLRREELTDPYSLIDA